MQVRLLTTGYNTGHFNMGLDEALLQKLIKNPETAQATLRLYAWRPATVTIGYFQSLAAEVDTDACASAQIPVIRRITGGGAVFHAAEITYSLVLPFGHPLAPTNIIESYGLITRGIIAALQKFNVDARFIPINDIIAGDKKISGNAQTRKQGCLLQHGTLLLDLEVDKMFSLLKVPEAKLKDKLISTVKERVTSLSTIVGRKIDYEEVAPILAEGFKESFALAGVELVPGELFESEIALAHELAQNKFSQDNWNQRR